MITFGNNSPIQLNFLSFKANSKNNNTTGNKIPADILAYYDSLFLTDSFIKEIEYDAQMDLWPKDPIFIKCHDAVETKFPHELYKHTQGVIDTAIELANKFNLDPDKAALAALLHDYSKHLPESQIIKLAKKNKIPQAASGEPGDKTLHGPVSAFLAKKEFGINDQDVLDALSYHTYGKPGMCNLAKLLLIADKIEPVRRDPFLREEALKIKDLNTCFAYCYRDMLGNPFEYYRKLNPELVMVWNDAVSNLPRSKPKKIKNI